MGLLKKSKDRAIDTSAAESSSPGSPSSPLQPLMPLRPGQPDTADFTVTSHLKDDAPTGLKAPVPADSANGSTADVSVTAFTPGTPPKTVGPAASSTPNNNGVHHTRHTPKIIRKLSSPTLTHTSTKEMKKSDSGIISSILNVAHNAASILQHSMDEDDDSHHGPAAKAPEPSQSFTHKLDSLLKPVGNDESRSDLDDNRLSHSGTHDTAGSLTRANPLATTESPSDVHFNSVRESPINSLGQGDLTLDAFDKKKSSPMPSRKTSVTRRSRGLSPDPTATALSPAPSRVTALKKAPTTASTASVGVPSLEKVKSPSSYSRSRSEDEEDDSESDSSDSELEDGVPRKGASRRRNREFHQSFKSIPRSEQLIDNFSCALNKDILVQGRMFLTKNYICFASNILGWSTHLVIPLREVIQIEKKSTAVLFPNGIVVKTLHSRYVFATFLSRDHTFRIIKNAWNQVLSKNGDARTARARAGRKSVDSSLSRVSDSDSVDDTDVDDDDDESIDAASVHLESDDDMVGPAADTAASPPPATAPASASGDGGLWNGLQLVGPATHPPTENGYNKQPNETFISDDLIKAPVGVVFNLMFGSDTDSQTKMLKSGKNFDITDISPLSKDHRERDFSYVKPLNGPIGPKQTKCNLHDKLLEFDPTKVIVVESTTQTPDVPSGNSFKVKSTNYLSWGPNNTTRLYMVTTVEWSGKSWIKGAIEKGSIDGQKESSQSVVKYLNDVVAGGGKKAPSPKKKKTRSRGNTVAVREKTPPPAPEPEKGLVAKINDVIESMGSMVPIPMVSSYMVGLVVVVVQFFVAVWIVNWLTGARAPRGHTLQVVPGDTFVSKVTINDTPFFVIPTVDNAFADPSTRNANAKSLWAWMQQRSQERLKFAPEPAGAPSPRNEALEEVIKRTQERLDQLAREIHDK
ncbi:hypothetical protein DICA3_F16732 [Diutina catenulata]